MKPMGLSESQLVDLIAGRLQGSLQQAQARLAEGASGPDLLPELGLEIAKAVAAAIQANNLRCAEQAHQAGSQAGVSTTQLYDHLSACIDGY